MLWKPYAKPYGSLMEALAESKSTNRRCSLKKGVLKYFAKFPRKTPVLESLFNKIAGLEAYDFIKKTLQHRCFPVKLAKFLRTPFFYRTPQVATSVLYESMEKVVKKTVFFKNCQIYLHLFSSLQ